MDTALPSISRTKVADRQLAHGVAVTTPHRMHAIPLPDGFWTGHTWLRIAYRVVECGVTVVMLAVAAPIMVIEALLIKLESRGPALFWQRRVGQSVVRRGSDIAGRDDLIPPEGGFQPDVMYLVPEVIDFVKFRTMYVDAPERFPELYDVKFGSTEAFLASYYKGENDPRVTPLGGFLRRTTLDELQNLFLVLSGKMRLVGPMPEGPWLVPYYTPEQMLKFAVKPGVTGLPQCSGRGQLPIGEQIGLDLDYVRRRSVWLDIRILIQTLLSVLRRKGAF